MLEAGNEGNIKIEGEENLLQYIVIEVKNGILIVKTEDRINLECSNNKTIKITIPFKDIDNVSLAGSGDLKLNIEASSIKASIAGSGDLTLKGSMNNLDANVSGSGDFHGFDLLSNTTDVSVAGSGDADVVSKESLKARVAGSGDIRYKGNPKTEDSKVAGSGSIESHWGLVAGSW